ncbi:surface-adhesin E family protein [Burkholderia gladioli]|uniref:surface-adhesin E family protein n=1 Tax=Burkholderia gladioli TaxID=28095 RepID=UPI003AFAF54F
MNRYMILIGALFIWSECFAADWVEIGASSEATMYLDRSSIRYDGQRIKAWEMLDFKTAFVVPGSYPQKFYRSNKQQHLIDCREGKSALLQYVSYDGQMGQGSVVGSGQDPARQPRLDDMVPDSIGESFLKSACSLKK